MKKINFNLFLSLLISTFALIWMSEKLALVIENEKYDFYKIVENNDAENKNENKIDAEYLNEIAILILENTNYTEIKKVSISHAFTIKEVFIEKTLPPPKVF